MLYSRCLPVLSSSSAVSRRTLLALTLFAAVLLVYQPTLNHAFIHFDDPAYIVENPNVNTGLSLANFRWAFSTFEQGNWHPLTWIWHQAVAQFAGINPRGHHLSSVLLHGFNTVLLFLLLCCVPSTKETDAQPDTTLRAFVVAALFALHPINVESVAWAAEHKSLLCMFFSILAVAAYGRYVQHRSVGRYMVVVALFAAALMAKPMAVTLPVLLLLIDYWPLERFDPVATNRRTVALNLIVEKLPLFAMSAASSWVTIVAQRQGEAFKGLQHVGLSLRIENAILSLAVYLRRLFWPADLAYFYPHQGSQLLHSRVAIALVVLLLLAALLWKFRSHRPLIFGFSFFVVALLPVLGILQVGFQAMADRYAYLPFIGIFIAIVWELPAITARRHFPERASVALVAIVLAALAATTIQTESYWRDSVALFTRGHNVVHPPDVFIETNLSAALLERGRPREALEHLLIAEQVAPQNFGTHNNVGIVLATLGDRQGALRELEFALRFPTTEEKKERVLTLIRQLRERSPASR